MIDANLLDRLRQRAIDLDQTGNWPREQFQWLSDAGITGWVIPKTYGGTDISQSQLIIGYEELAEACLTTAFILTQRNGACQRITGCQNEKLKQNVLPRLASGELFATVGISHLTTSRQHIHTPAVSVVQTGNALRLSGSIPWVTGAAHADYIVTGGTCEDGRQVLLALPTDLPGVTVQAHASLMALTASQTASVVLDQVELTADHLLAGPVHDVMNMGIGGGTGSQVTSTLAVAVAARAAGMIQKQAQRRPDLQETSERFSLELSSLKADLSRSVGLQRPAGEVCSTPQSNDPALSSAAIRQRANSLVLRITQAAMAVSKGAGFVTGHPAELAVRESLFFLVWSCPQPVVLGALAELSCRD